jgi:MFS family permease
LKLEDFLSAIRKAHGAVGLFVAAITISFGSTSIGAILPLIGQRFRVSTESLGLLLGVILAGTAIFQIPGGFAVLRYGARRVVLASTVLGGAAFLLAGLAGDFSVLTFLLFLTGVSSALLYAPALSLVSSIFSEGRRGPAVGFFWGNFNGVGGMVGLLLGAYLGLTYSWQAPLEVGGAGLLLIALVLWWSLPRESPASAPSHQGLWMSGRRVLRTRAVWGLALGLGGFAGAGYVPIYYLTTYFEQVHPTWGINPAAQVAAFAVLATLPGAAIGGWIADRGFDRRTIVMLFALAFGLVVLWIPYATLPLLWIIYLVAGFLLGVTYVVMDLFPSYLEETKGPGMALAVGLITTCQTLISSAVAIVFGFIAIISGYTAAWLFSAFLCLILLPLLHWVPPSRAARPALSRP